MKAIKHLSNVANNLKKVVNNHKKAKHQQCIYASTKCDLQTFLYSWYREHVQYGHRDRREVLCDLCDKAFQLPTESTLEFGARWCKTICLNHSDVLSFLYTSTFYFVSGEAVSGVLCHLFLYRSYKVLTVLINVNI